jgi:hypothetical protein
MSENSKKLLDENFKKYDEGKTRLELLPPEVMLATARVMMLGAEKYGSENYLKGTSYRRVIGALERHVLDFKRGIDLDMESGESHLAHAICCCMMLMEIMRVGTGTDDRIKSPV